MTQELITLLTSLLPLAGSLITAVVGLIVVALKYKKQKYAIAMLEEQNKFIEANKDKLTADEIAEIRAIIEEIKK